MQEALRVFLAQPGPRLLAKNAALSWATRAFLGPPRLSEIPVAAAAITWWPLQEWLAHRYLLHLRPRTILGRRIDFEAAGKHRAHHRDPSDLECTLLPMRLIRGALSANIAFWIVAGAGSPRRSVTGIATYASMALLYEWTHFLVHTGYRPRGAFFRRIRRNHRLHHFHNEGYWFSFTWPEVDRRLGTEPDPREVGHSETARDLHHEASSTEATTKPAPG